MRFCSFPHCFGFVTPPVPEFHLVSLSGERFVSHLTPLFPWKYGAPVACKCSFITYSSTNLSPCTFPMPCGERGPGEQSGWGLFKDSSSYLTPDTGTARILAVRAHTCASSMRNGHALHHKRLCVWAAQPGHLSRGEIVIEDGKSGENK